MLAILSSLLRHRRLLKDFVVRDLKARYVGSSMGFFWSVIFPIINLFVYMFVFRLVLNARWGDKQSAIEVAIVMLAGIVIWTAFAETISRATNCLVDNANLIQKVVFPSEILPSYLVLSSLVNMCIGLPVVLLAVLWMGHFAEPQVSIYVHHELLDHDLSGKPFVDDQGQVYKKPVAIPKVLHEREGHYGILVNLTRGWCRPITVPFRVSGTAVEGEDYMALGTRELTFPPGTIKGFINIYPLEDHVAEEPETVTIELGEPQGAGLRPEGAALDCSRTYTLSIRDWKAEDGMAAHEPPPPIWFPPSDETYHPLQLGGALAVLPLLLVLQALFTVGLGYFLCTFNLFLRDTFHLVGVGITVWMFATPIFYPGWMVAEKGFGWMLLINPMHWLIDSYRDVLLYDVVPPLPRLLALAGAAFVTLFVGARFFRANSAKIPDLL